MLELNYKSLADRAAWEAAGISAPKYDPQAVARNTIDNPIWMHFSAGNIFRAFIAALQDKLLNEKLTNRGIVVIETHDPEIIEKVYAPFDNLCISVTLSPKTDKRANSREPDVGTLIGSVSGAISTGDNKGYAAAQAAFRNPSLQLVSYTVTEKAYSLRGADGKHHGDVKADVENGPDRPANIIAVTASLLFERYLAGAYPISLVSMDNCSENGERLRASVIEIAEEWLKRGYCEPGFRIWLRDESIVAFPWSMIDKITPWPSDAVAKGLEDAGIAGMMPVATKKGAVVAPFVNTEPAQYLVIEDNFPGGRPPLEKAGVIFADRETVKKSEWMKVATCLNPLHTTLAIFGFLLGYERISDEMGDEALLALVRRVAYDEGLPVVANPGVIDPKAFIDEAVNERLPNPMLPDAPPRIAADTSQKIAIRFGGTIRAYMERRNAYADLSGAANNADCTRSTPQIDVCSNADCTRSAPQIVACNDLPAPSALVGIPLVLAGWLRYLLALDDSLNPYIPSPDPMLEIMRESLSTIEIRTGYADDPNGANAVKAIVKPILSNEGLFGADLYSAGLTDKIASMFVEMIEGPGAVRRTLERHLFI
jgi:fructuronate reductase